MALAGGGGPFGVGKGAEVFEEVVGRDGRVVFAGGEDGDVVEVAIEDVLGDGEHVGCVGKVGGAENEWVFVGAGFDGKGGEGDGGGAGKYAGGGS